MRKRHIPAGPHAWPLTVETWPHMRALVFSSLSRTPAPEIAIDIGQAARAAEMLADLLNPEQALELAERIGARARRRRRRKHTQKGPEGPERTQCSRN